LNSNFHFTKGKFANVSINQNLQLLKKIQNAQIIRFKKFLSLSLFSSPVFPSLHSSFLSLSLSFLLFSFPVYTLQLLLNLPLFSVFLTHRQHLFIFLFSAVSNEKIWIYHLSQASKPFIFLYFLRSNFFKRFFTGLNPEVVFILIFVNLTSIFVLIFCQI